ncbi:MAG: SDR family NAD(P)-dependent oxidoreductase [Thalassobaculum sp.]|uniref:SDR family NAD(P)-dependent oxidoreductase n=1 Tax=Thalassobaculum sp. TaxID=2022740 RepID=UPI0032EEB66D
MTDRPVTLIAGIGEGLGASLATTFAGAGYDVAGLSRSGRSAATIEAQVRAAGGSYRPLTADLGVEAEVAAAVAPLAARIEVVVHTAHRLVVKPFADTAPAEFEAVWRTGLLGAVHVARAVLPAMLARGHGTIVLAGATASVRAGARFAAFASTKFALRGLAQSLAREYGPAGIHVAHLVLDGLIDEPQTAARFGPGDGGRMDPGAVATACLGLVRQHPSAWTQELDLRPSTEKF